MGHAEYRTRLSRFKRQNYEGTEHSCVLPHSDILLDVYKSRCTR